MITFTTDTATRDQIAAALDAHGADRLAVAGLGRIRTDDGALATAAIVAAWPSGDDGKHHIALSDTAGLIAWRAFVIAEVAAGRGTKDGYLAAYREALGIETVFAFDYVCAVVKGRGIRPCRNAEHKSWSEGTAWVTNGGFASKPRGKWASSHWRVRATAHDVLTAAGLTRPFRCVWSPVPTCLFWQPKPDKPRPVLSLADDAAIAAFA